MNVKCFNKGLELQYLCSKTKNQATSLDSDFKAKVRVLSKWTVHKN